MSSPFCRDCKWFRKDRTCQNVDAVAGHWRQAFMLGGGGGIETSYTRE